MTSRSGDSISVVKAHVNPHAEAGPSLCATYYECGTADSASFGQSRSTVDPLTLITACSGTLHAHEIRATRNKHSPVCITDRIGASTTPMFSGALITLQNHPSSPLSKPRCHFPGYDPLLHPTSGGAARVRDTHPLLKTRTATPYVCSKAAMSLCIAPQHALQTYLVTCVQPKG
jgi:hypothetical protein